MPSNPRWRRLAGLLSGLAAVALAGGAAIVFAQAAHAITSPLRATFEVPDATKKGYDVQYTVANIGKTSVTGWKVEFDLPTGTAISKAKGVVLSHPSANRWVLASKPSSATIAGGASRMFSFLATGLGRPTNCLVNGASCTAPVPTPAPSPTTIPGTARDVNVATVAQLKSALAGAHPGDVIHLADGTYKGAFYTIVSGTSTAPITLTGSRNAVLTNSGGACDPNVPKSTVSYCGYGFHLNTASWWKLVGFTVTTSAKGIVFDAAQHSVIDGVQVMNSSLEGIHLRTSSADNVVQHAFVHDTGKTDPGFGEGLYFGSAISNWDKFGTNNGTGPDRSDRNRALTNSFGPNVGGEHIDIKEGTVNGLVSGNTFTGGLSGLHFADSWVDVKGSGYTLTGNTGTFVAGTGVLVDGYQVHQQRAGDGCGNVWHSNKSDLGGVGNWAINVTDQSGCSTKPNVIYSSNTVTNAVKGLTNIKVTPGV
jgi:hypothetical protein